jgi:hypothetical protein
MAAKITHILSSSDIRITTLKRILQAMPKSNNAQDSPQYNPRWGAHSILDEDSGEIPWTQKFLGKFREISIFVAISVIFEKFR